MSYSGLPATGGTNRKAPLQRDVEKCLDELINSRVFAKTDALRRLVEYLVRCAIAGEARQITEASIASAVLKRGTDFNATLDSNVRKTMGRLREKLDKYYATEGRGSVLRIILERGSYIPVFVRQEDISLPFQPASALRILLLPFDPVNFHDIDFFTDGLFEDLMIGLAAGSGVKVVPWTTARYLRDKTGDMREFQRISGADVILVGTVRKLGDDFFQITVSWVEGLTAVFDYYMQVRTPRANTAEAICTLCEQITKRLGTRFALEAQNQIEPRQSSNTEARSLFLRARQANRLGTVEGTRTSFAYLTRALELQPDYAAAHALMADAHIYAGISGFGQPKVEMRLAAESVEKALHLAPGLASALAAKGGTQFAFHWDFAGASRSLANACSLDPTSDSTHFWSEALIAAENNPTAAALRMEAHAESDNCSASTAYLASTYCYNAYQWKRTEFWARRSIELEPTYFRPYPFLAGAYLELGRHEEALTLAETSRRLSGPNPYTSGMLGIVLSRMGRRSEARAVLEDYNSMKGFPSSLGKAVVWAEMGEADQAMDAIGQMIEDREPYTTWLHVFPFFRNLHTTSRFQGLLAKRRTALV